MGDGLSGVRDLLPGARLGRPTRLVSSDRAAVYRVPVEGLDSPSLIVKRYAARGEGWVRETAALRVLPAGLRAPALVAESIDPPVLVTTDVGTGVDLADLLMGEDPQQAAALLADWGRGLAAVHSATHGLRAAFAAELTARGGEVPVHDARLGLDIDDAVRVLDRVCASIGVVVPAGALDELRELNHRLGAESAGATLTPADSCPDDNVATPDGVVLVDYENAQWRHVAWDVAYLRVPWPTCWCAWRLPTEVADAAVEAYRQAAAGAFPAVGDADFVRDLDAATVGWSLMSAALSLEDALGDEPVRSGRYARGPTRRASVLHRLDRASRLAVLPAASDLAAALRAELRARWGDVPLQLAPAFR